MIFFVVLDIAEKYIDPVMKDYLQVDSSSILSGYAKFHSSLQPKLGKVCREIQYRLPKTHC